MESSPKTASLRSGGLVLALALAFGVVGANAFADAAGFTAWDTDHPAGQFLRVLCGFVLFLLSWMLLRFLFQLGTQIVWRLGQVRERPGLPIAITLLACGTLCVLGALLVAWQGNTGSVNMSPTMNLPGNMPGQLGNMPGLPGNMPGANMVPRVDLSMQTTGSLIRPMAVCAAFVIGVALLALGVWSSLAPAPANVALKSVPEESSAS
jgi:hypothetical protein